MQGQSDQKRLLLGEFLLSTKEILLLSAAEGCLHSITIPNKKGPLPDPFMSIGRATMVREERRIQTRYIQGRVMAKVVASIEPEDHLVLVYRYIGIRAPGNILRQYLGKKKILRKGGGFGSFYS